MTGPGANLTGKNANEIEKLEEVISVPRHWIRPFPNQPREYFDPAELDSLARSIGKFGQLVPAIVKDLNGSGGAYKLELTDGQRRWHALAMAGVAKMKVIVRNVEDEGDQFLQSVVANFGRAEHTPVEIAKAIGRFKAQGMTEQEIADIFAKSNGWVNQHYKIMKLVPEVLKLLSPEIPEENRMTFTVALMIADVPADLQMRLANEIIVKKMKLGQARNMIRVRAEKMGFKVGDPRRSAYDDFRVLRNFIYRFQREAEIFGQLPQSYFNKLFQNRGDDEREKMVTRLNQTIKELQGLNQALERATRKAPTANKRA